MEGGTKKGKEGEGGNEKRECIHFHTCIYNKPFPLVYFHHLEIHVHHYKCIVRSVCGDPKRGACAFDGLTYEIAMLIAFLNAC